MTHAIRFSRTGSPDVLEWQEVGAGGTAPEPGQARVRHAAVGVNFIDIYHRTGLYPLPLPSGLGLEAAGVVEAVGAGVSNVKVGERVAYAGGAPGAYAEVRDIAADRLVHLPDAVPFDTAAAMMLKGLTAQYLLRQTFVVKPGDTVLVHAAAGGVGLILCQWAKHLGATVIGTVGSEAKAALAAANGCDHPVVYTREAFTPRVRELTGGRGVDVVYDSIGKDTFFGSLDCLRPLGMMVSYGNASGAVPAFEIAELAKRGSLFVTRPTLVTYTAAADRLAQMAADLFAVVTGGQVKVHIGARFPLARAGQAQAALESRQTTGALLLEP
jgi:NADPH2:quinone reductase